jgi:hypothetical protein
VRLVRLPDAAVWPVIESAAAGGLLTRVGQQHAIMDEVVLARVGEALTRRGIRLEATTPETAAGPLLSGGAGAPAPERDSLQTLRGRALREFLTEAIDRDRRVVILHQAANQKAPRRMTIKPNYLDHRPTGYYVSARTEQQTERAFKLDDIFGIALEEQP